MEAAAGGAASSFPDPRQCSVPQILLLAGFYLYVLFRAAGFLGDGGALLLLLPRSAPAVASIVLPVLGAVPDAVLVLFSGFGGTGQLAVGLGVLAGSTVELITVAVYAAVAAGRVAFRDGRVPAYAPPKGVASAMWCKRDPDMERGLCRTGVGYGKSAKSAGKAMLTTTLGYVVVQGGSLLAGGEGEHKSLPVVVGIAICAAELLCYLVVCWAASRLSGAAVDDHIADANIQALRDGTLSLRGAMADLGDRHWAATVRASDLETALLNTASEDEVRRMCRFLAPFFGRYAAQSEDGRLDFEGFRMVLNDVNENLPRDAEFKVFEAADADCDGRISFEEFAACLTALVFYPSGGDAAGAAAETTRRKAAPKMFLTGDEAQAHEVEDGGLENEEEDEPVEVGDVDPADQQQRIKTQACAKIAGGLLLLLVFAGPVVAVLSELAARLGVSAFYVAFLLVPPTTCAGEVVAAYTYAAKRTRKSMTTLLSTLQGAAVVNNTLCLGVFLCVVHAKSMAWEFSAETLPVVLVEMAIGMSVVCRGRLTLFDGVCALALYPASLLMSWMLQRRVGLA